MKAAKTVQTDGSQAFYVKIDARVNKEKPFTNPDFNQQSLAKVHGCRCGDVPSVGTSL